MAKAQLSPELSQAARLLHAGRFKEAEAACRKVLTRNKRDVDAHQMLGLIASTRGRLEEAVQHFQRGLRIRSNGPMLLCGLAKVRTAQGRFDDAIASYEKALSAEPGYPPALAGLADAYEHQGRFDEALRLLEPIVRAGEEDGETAYIYGTLLQRSDRHDDAIAVMERHLATSDRVPVTRRKLLYGLGQSYHKRKSYDRAFDAYRRANEILRAPFDIEAVRRQFDRVTEMFSPEFVESMPRAGNGSEVPMFVVSMPRSGSTLVEQILAAHPQVFGAGEIEEMIRRFQELLRESPKPGPWPDVMRSVDRATLDRLATRHLGRLRLLDKAADRIIDKNLQNFRLLGLIAAMFPKARVIFCKRDPMSVCFSCFTLPLSAQALPYTTDLRHLGQFYREHERLVEHWMRVLDIPILQVDYEDLVADQEGMSRRIIDFAGLDWNDACLRFHESKRDVSTASYDQVRKPIYKNALKRYENYEEWLGPLREGLEA